MAQSSYLLAADPAVDLAVVAEMAQELQTYIVNDDLYRTIVVSTPAGEQRIRMTGGDLLARLYRLQHDRSNLTPAQQAQLDAVQESVDATIYSLRTRFHERLQRELGTRLNSLAWFLDDCAKDLQRCRADFPFEMRNRQRIEEILKELGDTVDDAMRARLQQVDQRIRRVAHGSGFTWDKRLQHIFPQHPYWYLYMTP